MLKISIIMTTDIVVVDLDPWPFPAAIKFMVSKDSKKLDLRRNETVVRMTRHWLLGMTSLNRQRRILKRDERYVNQPPTTFSVRASTPAAG